MKHYKFVRPDGSTIETVLVEQNKRGRWFYRTATNKMLLGSGMTPETFQQQFWLRSDLTVKEVA